MSIIPADYIAQIKFVGLDPASQTLTVQLPVPIISPPNPFDALISQCETLWTYQIKREDRIELFRRVMAWGISETFSDENRFAPLDIDIDKPSCYYLLDGLEEHRCQTVWNRPDGSQYAVDINGVALYRNGEGHLHRLDGPAVRYTIKHPPDDLYQQALNAQDEWYINDDEITPEVEAWIAENELPPWQEWDDEIKALFVLVFA